MNDRITLSDNDNGDSVNKNKLRSEAVKMKIDEINENLEKKRFFTRDASKNILNLNSITNSIKGRKNTNFIKRKFKK